MDLKPRDHMNVNKKDTDLLATLLDYSKAQISLSGEGKGRGVRGTEYDSTRKISQFLPYQIALMGGGVRDFERDLACNRETRLNVSMMLLLKKKFYLFKYS